MNRVNTLKSIFSSYWMLGLLFIVFLIFLRVSPMMYDGWFGSNYYNERGGLINWIIYMRQYYNMINGRVASTFVSGFLESFPSEIVYDVANAFVMTVVCWSLFEIFQVRDTRKKLLGTILFFSLVFFMPGQMRAYVIQIANASFIPPVLFSLLFFLIARDYVQSPEHSPRWMLWTLCILSFCLGTWLESSAMGFGITLGLTLIYLTYRRRKIYWYLWIATGVAFFSGLLMMLSPGLRASRTLVVGEADIQSLFLGNIDRIYKFLFYDNRVMVVVFLLLFAYAVAQRGWKEKHIYKFVSIAFLIFAIGISIYFVTQESPPSQSMFEYDSIVFHRLTDNIYAILVLIGIALLAILGSRALKNPTPLALMAAMAAFSLGPTSLTPNIASRVASIGFFMGLGICIGLFSELDLTKNTWPKKALLIGVICLGILALDKEILLFRRINTVTMERDKLAEEAFLRQRLGDWDYDSDVLRLPVYRDGDVSNRGVVYEGTFHYIPFLRHYNLADRTMVIFTDSAYFTIYTEVSKRNLTFTVKSDLPLRKNDRFYYEFYNYLGTPILNSVTPVEDIWTVKCPEGRFNVKAYHAVVANDGSTVKNMTLIDQPISLLCQ